MDVLPFILCKILLLAFFKTVTGISRKLAEQLGGIMHLASRFAFLGLIFIAVCFAQSPSTKEIMVANPGEMKWQHDAGDPPGSESIVLRGDPSSAGFELFARYPGGHVFAPHWHSANERIVLISGKMSIQAGATTKFLEAGGFAYLPAKEVQKMACVSNTQCTFYVYWDGKLDFHPAGN